MQFTIRSLTTGLLSNVPFFYKATYLLAGRGGGASKSSHYCYEVWLAHLLLARRFGMQEIPKSIAEVGPGHSMGVGIAALLTGVERYTALDLIPYRSAESDLIIFDELVPYIQSGNGFRRPPEFPDLSQDLRVPLPIKAPSIERLSEIQAHLKQSNDNSCLRYLAPWNVEGKITPSSFDLLLSNAALEHVDDIDFFYESSSLWLKPGGYVTHRIDFGCHGTAPQWNGHWGINDFWWRHIRGNRPYSISRNTLSMHLKSIERAGFKVLGVVRQEKEGIQRTQLSSRYKDISDGDLKCRQAFVVCQKI